VEEFQRALDEIRARRPGGPRDRATKAAQREALQHVQGPTVVFDCSFDELMEDRDRTSLGVQIRTSYGLNVRGAAPVAFVVTSMTPKLQTILDPQHDKWIMRFDERHYLEAFPEKEKIVYLTAESDNVLETLDVDTKYIVGGVVDHNRHKGHCHHLAVDNGVRTARLPIDEYMSRAATGSRQVITVNQVFQILLEFNATRSWSAALGKAMPQRKGFVLKNDDAPAGDEHEAVAADESIDHIESITDTVAVQL
jgi:tRNA (guanine9-N1)-methyltransferase